MARLVSTTAFNPFLTESVSLPSNLYTIQQGQGTPLENLVEYAGRLCYASTARMGTAENFIAQRVREGHMDILEHAVISVEFKEILPDFFVKVREQTESSCRYYESTVFENGGYITGNLRVWYELFKNGYFLQAVPIIKPLVPKIFAEFEPDPTHLPFDWTGIAQKMETLQLPYLETQTALFGVSVTFLAANVFLHPKMMHHSYATFLVEGVSRACSHQFVRHRAASFSQVSQRYVDLEKGKWGYIVPPRIEENQDALSVYLSCLERLEAGYTRLRSLGVRKEDARFLLPNATGTRFVVTMGFPAWAHFCKIRALDKASQWEIRQAGEFIYRDLLALSPDYFGRLP